MPRIRHLAICTDRQEELAAFYRTTFGMTEMTRHASATSGKLGIYLSDGEINLAFIPAHGKTEGLNHFGFEVDSVDKYAETALAGGALQGAEPVPQDGRQNEAWIADPIGQRVDLSSRGWLIGGGGKGRIQHVAIKTDYPDKLATFYMQTFGLHEIMRREKERGAVYISDGHVNLALLPNNNGEEEPADRMGIDHFGFYTEDVDATLKTAYDNGAKPSNRDLPRDGRFAEVFMRDPIGQRVDLSQAGWKTQP
jgi:catechol 2,3-dioxygenase-like lactoylglutathione lyase family enzyme